MKRSLPRVVLLAAFSLPSLSSLPALSAESRAGNVYVSPQGNDAWSGRLAAPNADKTDGPVRTLKRAAGLVTPGEACLLREGVYAETLRPARGGTAGKSITFGNYRGERAVVSGADPVAGWQKAEGGVWTAPVDWDLKDGNQVFADGAMLTEARWPDNTGTLLQPVRARVQSGSPATVTDPNLPGQAGAWNGALLWCAGGAEWLCWTARVTAFDARTRTLTFDKKQERNFYTPRKGNPYVLMGVRRALDAPGEWWLDGGARRLHLIPPAGKTPDRLRIEMKRRPDAIDLSGLSHIRIAGLHFRAGGVRTDGQSSDIVLDGLRGRYVGHSYENDISGRQGVLVCGRRIAVRNCELAYSSGSIVHVAGADNRIVNCYIHDGNYGAKWRGPLTVAGRRHVIAWNTVRHSGRDVVNIHGLTESLIEHNDLSDAGWLTSDLGLTYGHNTDFGNTEIRYNLVHDNHAPACNMGIYFDHLSHNVIVHHNIVWNINRDPIRINNPSYHNLVDHNTCWNTGPTVTFDHARRNDLFGTRYTNNILNDKFRLPAHVAVEHNLITKTPALADPKKLDFALTPAARARDAGVVLEGMAAGVPDGKPDMGALDLGRRPWRAGHDFANPPRVPIHLKRPRIAYMNMVRNACFELDTLEHWTKTGPGQATLVKGNGWGVTTFGGNKETHATGTSKRELRLTGPAGVEQAVEDLHAATNYTLSAWLRVSDAKESVTLGVRAHGPQPATATSNSTKWVRKTIPFRTGPSTTGCVIFITKPTPGPAHAGADNVALPLSPKGS